MFTLNHDAMIFFVVRCLEAEVYIDIYEGESIRIKFAQVFRLSGRSLSRALHTVSRENFMVPLNK